jgi:hypothetical protein
VAACRGGQANSVESDKVATHRNGNVGVELMTDGRPLPVISLSVYTNSMSHGFVTEMLTQQSTGPVKRPRAHHFEGMPKADLVCRQDGFSQIGLQPIDDAKRTPVATSQHDSVGVRPVHAAPDIEGGLRIEQADLEIAEATLRLMRCNKMGAAILRPIQPDVDFATQRAEVDRLDRR